MKATNLTASTNPRSVIESLPRRPEQPASMRQYKDGYEAFFNLLPNLSWSDPLLKVKTEIAGDVMKSLAETVAADESLMRTPPVEQFDRVILAVEDPNEGQEGSEVLVARWGRNFASPVHGHAPGLLHEEVLSGKLRVNTYRHVKGDLVRPLETEIVGPGTLVSKYSQPSRLGRRSALVHNFVAVEPSVTLHFVPEHTRDGRDNKYRVEHFEDFNETSFEQLDIQGGIYLQIGDVALVRSANVPEYGDHFIVITGGPILKPHGLRPAERAIQAGPLASTILDNFSPVGNTGLTLLKLDDDTRRRFLEFHGIVFAGNVPFWPKP